VKCGNLNVFANCVFDLSLFADVSVKDYASSLLSAGTK